jgi:ring-1,2-phenylacetyl-CoA epoxidase subunit PaaE
MELLQWKILQVIPETRNAKTFLLEEINGKQVSYEAGQFFTFLFNDKGHEIRRSFSIASTPGLDTAIAITVMKKINGEISRHILENWEPGTVVSSIGAAGRFTVNTDSSLQRHIYLVAAGSGIVPVYALLKKILHEELKSRVTLVYQNHDEYNIIYREHLHQLAQQYATRFNKVDLLSNPVSHAIHPYRLNNTLFEHLMNEYPPADKQTALIYTCGPIPFMRMVQFTAKLMGFTDEQIRKENFTVDPVPVSHFSMKAVPHAVVLHYAKETHEFTTTFPDTILQSAEKNGIALPFSCRAGRCSTCIAKCVKGSVKMSINEVLTEKDLQEGLVLTCVGYAETDVELEF